MRGMSVAVLVVVLLVVCGLTAGSMAQNRGNAFWPYFTFGCLLGVIGIFLAAVASPPQQQQFAPKPQSPKPREPRTRAERRIAERFSRD